MELPARLRECHVVFCDDVRTEKSGKDILIGTLHGDLVLKNFTDPYSFFIWIQYILPSPWKGFIFLRLISANNDILESAKFDLRLVVFNTGCLRWRIKNLSPAKARVITFQYSLSNDGGTPGVWTDARTVALMVRRPSSTA